MKSLFTLLGIVLAFHVFSQDLKDTYKGKIADLTAQIAREPADPSLYYARGDAYDAIEDFARSNRDYTKVINLYLNKPNALYQPHFIKACYRLADEYFFRQANPEKALAYVQEGLKEVPGYKELEILDAIITGMDPQKRELAAQKYLAVSAKYPDDVRMNLYYGKFLQSTDPIAAAARYEKALSADGQNKEVLLALGTLYNNEATLLSGEGKDPDKVFEYAKKATAYFETLYNLNPHHPEVTNILLRLYEELDQQDKAAALKSPY